MKGRRQWSRFVEGSHPTSIISPDGIEILEILDESFSGLGIKVGGKGPLNVGDGIELQYGDAPMAGVVRVIQELPDGNLRLGIEWVRPE